MIENRMKINNEKTEVMEICRENDELTIGNVIIKKCTISSTCGYNLMMNINKKFIVD